MIRRSISIFVTVFVLCFALGTVAHAGQLTTTFAANNGQAGNMFDVDVLARPMTVTDLEVNVGNANYTLRVYYRTGTWVGNENAATGWTLHTSQIIAGQGNNNVTPVDIPDLQLAANTSYGFYVTLTGTGMRYRNGTGVGNVAAANADLIIYEGSGKSFAFGATFQPRIWNGTFIYEIYDAEITKMVDKSSASAVDELLTYTINVENTGDTNLTGVSVTDQLSQGAATTALTVTGPAADIGTAGELDVGETWVFTALHNVTSAEYGDGSDLVNTVTINAAELSADYDSDSAVTSLVQNPQIEIIKSAIFVTGAPPAGAGEVVRYSYRVENTGNVILQNIRVSDLTNGSDPSFLGGSNPGNPDHEATLTLDAGPASGDSPDTSPSLTVWGTLAPGDVITFTADYTVTQLDVDNLQ